MEDMILKNYGILIIVAVFLIGGACIVASVAAETSDTPSEIAIPTVSHKFKITQEAVSTPSDSLLPGDKVSTNMKIKYSKGDMNFGSSLKFDTDLVNSSWNVDVWKGGSIITTLYPSDENGHTISGFDLSGYGIDIELAITVNGMVSSSSAGKTITPIKLRETVTRENGSITYFSMGQYVIDPSATPTPTPTTLPTRESPAPFIGLIAGLGIAGLGIATFVLRKMRK